MYHPDYGWYDPRPGAYGDDDPGGGPWLPEYGIREWWNPTTAHTTSQGDDIDLSWGAFLEHWSTIECELHEVFGIDVESGILSDRSWRWFMIRVVDLIARPHSRLARALGILKEDAPTTPLEDPLTL